MGSKRIGKQQQESQKKEMCTMLAFELAQHLDPFKRIERNKKNAQKEYKYVEFSQSNGHNYCLLYWWSNNCLWMIHLKHQTKITQAKIEWMVWQK